MKNEQKLEVKHYYALLGFLSPIAIECIDNLQGTDKYRHELKYHLNKSLSILEQINKEFFNHFIARDNDQTDPNSPRMQDIYMVVYKSYDDFVKLLTKLEPNDLPSAMDIFTKIINQVDLKNYKFGINALQR